MSALIDLTDKRFFRLLVLCRAETNGKSGTYWEARCDCGNDVVVRSGHLLTGKTVSCGCYGTERKKICNTVHGAASRGEMTNTYRSWQAMRQRCTSPDVHHKKYYLGIKICERWMHSFDNFLEDMGERPSGATIDRYPNAHGNYEPGNCRWATHTQQMRNRRHNRIITVGGSSRTCAEWAEVTGLSPDVIYQRAFRLKWAPEEVVSKPLVYK